FLLLRIALDTAGLDQHRAGTPLLHQVAERTRVELVVPARDMAADARLQRGADQGRNADRAFAHVIDLALPVERRGEQGDGGTARGVADPVARALVVQVEAEGRLQAVTQRLERAGFGRGQRGGVAVDVDALRVATLEAGGAVGVEDRYDVQAQPLPQAIDQRVRRRLAEEVEQVGQRHAGGAFIAMHLRPEQDAGRAVSPTHVTQRAALGAVADRFDREPGFG